MDDIGCGEGVTALDGIGLWEFVSAIETSRGGPYLGCSVCGKPFLPEAWQNR